MAASALFYLGLYPFNNSPAGTGLVIAGAIAFVTANGQTSFDLRLVGFPGVVEIDRTQPIALTNFLGKTLTAVDDSRDIFTEAAQPGSNVGQYDLQPLLPELEAEIPLTLTLPTTGSEATILSISPATIEEWKNVAGQK